MSAEVSLYESTLMLNGNEILIDTKSIYLCHEEYVETQIFQKVDDGWEMLDVISHNDDEDLKAAHQNIVSKWKDNQ